jgi:hypothetical protein
MKKIFYFILFLALAGALTAQTPQFYNFTTQGVANSFPFNQAGGKMAQWIIRAGEYSQPAPATAGNITKFYFFCAPTYPLNSTYTQFYIRMGRSALTNLPTGQFYNGPMDTVFHRASGYNINVAASAWWEFVLDQPFAYYPDSSLIIEIGQCSSTQGTGFSAMQQSTVSQQKLYSVGGCPFVYSGAQLTRTLNSGITVAPMVQAPDYIYYKFEDNPSSTSTPNCAFPGVGTTPAPLTNVTLGSGGQFDSCLASTGITNGGVNTGWNCNFGTGSWTISMWLEATTTTFGYIFGDAGSGSFRCFNNGAAGTNGITLRGTGITNVDVSGFASGPVVVHFVYDSALSNIKVYKNGVLTSTVSQTPLNISAGSGFKVGGYSTSATFTGKLDEFRIYKRALDSTEVAATWDMNIPCALVTGVSGKISNIPANYMLYQNYPNPFNPSTKISYAIPKAGNVELKVYDVLGREIAVLVNEFRQAGKYSVTFDAGNLSSGVYFYTVKSGDFTDTKKMTLIK